MKTKPFIKAIPLRLLEEKAEQIQEEATLTSFQVEASMAYCLFVPDKEPKE